MESREEKFKRHREKIELQDCNDNADDLDLEQKEDDNASATKNTLTMSIDKIIEAHDEYTVIIEKNELKEKIRLEKKMQQKKSIKSFFKFFALGVALALIVIVVLLIILTILN